MMNASSFTKDAEAELALLREKVETLMSERVTPAVTRFAGQAEDAARAARAQMRDGVDHLSDHVRERPLTSIGLAVLAGVLLAAVIRR